MMLQSGNFLLLDEPTNHLDLESITALNKGMINFKGAMIFASHDQEIVETTANRIFDFVDENTFKDNSDMEVQEILVNKINALIKNQKKSILEKKMLNIILLNKNVC